MKSPFFFIVEPLNGKRYNNTKEIGGVEFITSTSEEDHKFSNREAKVIETPIDYNGPIKKGDILLVHHNVFKFYNEIEKVAVVFLKAIFSLLSRTNSFYTTTVESGRLMIGIALLSL